MLETSRLYLIYNNIKIVKNPSRKINCWDFVKCGREFRGEKVAEMGICPASIDISSDGLNDGKNGGRICWAIAGTFCGEKIKGFFAKKLLTCKSCIFFKIVKREEGNGHFRLTKPNDTHSHIKCTDLDEHYVVKSSPSY